MDFSRVQSKTFSTLRIVYVMSVLPAAHAFATTEIVEGNHSLVKMLPHPPATAEHTTAVGAESKPADEGPFWESDVETIVCFLAVLFLFGVNHFHRLFVGRAKKVDKMGHVLERKGAIANRMPARKRPAEAPAKYRADKPGNAMPAKAKETIEEKASYHKERAECFEVLGQHAKALNVGGIESTLQEMERRFGALYMTEYSLGISHLGKAGEVVKAHTWLRRAVEVGRIPRQCTFNSVISAYVKIGELDQALNVADDMKGMGLQFDTITYNTIIEGWARAGDATTCQLWMKKMLDSGVKASVVTFGSVMRACANAGLTTEVEDWYALSQSLSIELNLICFSSVMNAFARRDDLVSARTWLTRCIDHGVQPNVHCFTGMLSSVLKDGQLDQAAEVIGRMRASGVQPDTGVFSTCILTAVKVGQRQRAQDWADECVVCKCRLTRAAETALIQARLRVPNFKKEPKVRTSQEVAAGSDRVAVADAAEAKCDEQNGPEGGHATNNFSEQTAVADQQALNEARMACVGRTYQGTIKDFIQHRFGYIICEETFAVFQRDIFLGREDNPDLLAKGQRVSFTLRIDPRAGLPRASDVKVYRP